MVDNYNLKFSRNYGKMSWQSWSTIVIYNKYETYPKSWVYPAINNELLSKLNKAIAYWLS